MKNMPMPVIQTGNETNYILLITSIVVSLLGIAGGIVILKKNNKKCN